MEKLASRRLKSILLELYIYSKEQGSDMSWAMKMESTNFQSLGMDWEWGRNQQWDEDQAKTAMGLPDEQGNQKLMMHYNQIDDYITKRP